MRFFQAAFVFVMVQQYERLPRGVSSGTVEEAEIGQPRARPLTSGERSGPHASRATGELYSHAAKMLVCVLARFGFAFICLDGFAGE